ncbi:MAG: hypothetical protein GW903_04550 [Alphaproteobacteria bacterium]|nr:hypothetical protein [Alphaproteobacteria bacterium]NCQ88240.1 hypothetical protein [Alphaproteobacteria bacterium]NCT05253.1 hypothetical protein [Alphaproteobacteria bacterium]
MPHIIVEYSKNLEAGHAIQPMIEKMHAALAQEGVDQSRIKTRAIALDHYVVGDKGNAGAMCHITLLLLEGRDDATKNKYGAPLHEIAVQTLSSKALSVAVTLEVRDMQAASYLV